MENEEKKPGWKKHILFYVIEALFLAVAVTALVFVNKITKIEKVKLDESKIAVNVKSEATPEPEMLEKPSEVMPTAPADINDEKDIDKDKLSKELYKKYDGNFNIAFFGVDSRDGDLGAGTRSDSIMVCSVDMETHEVKLISFFRDTYLCVGNDKYKKCNAAYALGGPEQALSMINTNADLYVNQYVTVGFEGLMDAIDALGGVPINVDESEIFHLNNYQMTMAEQLGVPYVPVVFPGMQMLNGLQATAYCRIRYTKGDDFKRAMRQRDVIEAMLQRTSAVSVSTMASALTKIMPNISTSLNIDDIVSMLSLAGDYKVTVSEGFPFDGMRNGGNIGTEGSCVIPTDLVKNVKKLHELLYDEENYEPSDTVKKFSSNIKTKTQDYLQY